MSPAPPATTGALVHAPAAGEHGAQLAGRLGALEERRHLVAVQVRSRRAARPTSRASPTSSHERAGGVRHVGGVVAGQPEAHIVLRQEHLGDVAEDLRLVPLHPDELRRGEAGQDDVAGDLAEARIGVELRRLLGRAAVVPQDAGAERPVGVVEQRRAVHVAGEADAAHALHLGGMRLGERVDGAFDVAATSSRDPARTSRDAAARHVERLARARRRSAARRR